MEVLRTKCQSLRAGESCFQIAGMQHQANEQRINHFSVQYTTEGDKHRRKQKSLHVKYWTNESCHIIISERDGIGFYFASGI